MTKNKSLGFLKIAFSSIIKITFFSLIFYNVNISFSHQESDKLDFSSLDELYEHVVEKYPADKDRIVFASKYISARMLPRSGNSGARTDYSPNSIFASKWGACGSRDIVLEELAKKLGIPHRRVSFDRVPYQIGHVASEFYVDGKWLFTDSTFGVFITDLTGEILSLDEAIFQYPNVKVYRTRSVWLGNPVGNSDVELVLNEDNLVYTPLSSTPRANIQRTYFDAEISGADVRSVTRIPIVIDENTTEMHIGEVNDSASDVHFRKNYSGNIHSENRIGRIGRYYHQNFSHKFVFTGQSSRYKIEYHMIRPSEKIEKMMIDLDYIAPGPSDGFDYDLKYDGNKIEVIFDHKFPMSEMKFTLPWSLGTMYVDKISVLEID